MPKVSVIIPVYNAEKFIGNCIQSFERQTLSDFEIIFINDCSGDSSASIIKEYASRDKRIVFIDMERNVGPMTAREHGYRRAKGDFITFCDSDDTLPERALQQMYEMAVEQKADIVAGNAEYIHLDGTSETWASSVQDKVQTDGLGALLRGEMRHNLWAKLFSRNLFDGFSHESIEGLRYFEDYLLMYQLMERAKKVAVLDQTVYNYIQTEGSSTQLRMNEKRLDDIVKAHKIVFTMLFPKNGLRKDLFAHNQLYFSRLLAQEPGIKEMLYRKLEEYGLRHLMSNSAILSNNSLPKALKLIVAKEAGPFLLRMKSNRK